MPEPNNEYEKKFARYTDEQIAHYLAFKDEMEPMAKLALISEANRRNVDEVKNAYRAEKIDEVKIISKILKWKFQIIPLAIFAIICLIFVSRVIYYGSIDVINYLFN